MNQSGGVPDALGGRFIELEPGHHQLDWPGGREKKISWLVGGNYGGENVHESPCHRVVLEWIYEYTFEMEERLPMTRRHHKGAQPCGASRF